MTAEQAKVYSNISELRMIQENIGTAGTDGSISTAPGEALIISSDELSLNGSIWPVTTGGDGQVLTTDSLGNLYWGAGGGGVCADQSAQDTGTENTGNIAYFINDALGHGPLHVHQGTGHFTARTV